jgi:hypothetical protein
LRNDSLGEVAVLAESTAGLACDYDALRGAQVALASAAAELDAAGRAPSGDHGEAAGLLAVLVAALSESAARLVAEGKVLGLGVRVAATGLAATDAEQALRFVEVGP